ncbi:MAG: succinate dehydrogenase, cytochrome b556 subunit [Pseudomonadota bacterium]
MAHVQDRPLSPHLQIWRWHVTMLASIAHRASGVAMYVGVLGLAGWLLALALGGDLFVTVDTLVRSLLGQVALYTLVAAFGYHLCNGLRHLFWDFGAGFKPAFASMTAWAALAVGVIGAPLALFLLLNVAG